MTSDTWTRPGCSGMMAPTAHIKRDREDAMDLGLQGKRAILASDKAWAVSGELVVATGGAGRAVYY
jgi:hypothetical protein